MFKKFFYAILLSSALPIMSMEQPSFEWELLPPEIKQEIAQKIIDDTKLKESKELFKRLRATNKFFSDKDFITSFKNTVIPKAKEESLTIRLQLGEQTTSLQTTHHINKILSRSLKCTNHGLDSMETEYQQSINTLQKKLDAIDDILRFFDNNSEKSPQKK